MEESERSGVFNLSKDKLKCITNFIVRVPEILTTGVVTPSHVIDRFIVAELIDSGSL